MGNDALPDHRSPSCPAKTGGTSGMSSGRGFPASPALAVMTTPGRGFPASLVMTLLMTAFGCVAGEVDTRRAESLSRSDPPAAVVPPAAAVPPAGAPATPPAAIPDRLPSPPAAAPAPVAPPVATGSCANLQAPPPPPPGEPVSPGEAAALETWLRMDLPADGCTDAGAGSDAAPARPDAGPDPFAAAAVCTSRSMYTGGEGPRMRPGDACIACHREDDLFLSQLVTAEPAFGCALSPSVIGVASVAATTTVAAFGRERCATSAPARQRARAEARAWLRPRPRGFSRPSRSSPGRRRSRGTLPRWPRGRW